MRNRPLTYTAEAFDKQTEVLSFEVSLPDGCDAQLARLMGWSVPQRGDEGYDLDATQIAALEVLANRQFYDSDHVFQLTCNVA
jgi:hypothetical protein